MLTILATLCSGQVTTVKDQDGQEIHSDFTYEFVDLTCADEGRWELFTRSIQVTTQNLSKDGQSLYMTRIGQNKSYASSCSIDTAQFLASYDPVAPDDQTGTANVRSNYNQYNQNKAIGLNFLAADGSTFGVSNDCAPGGETVTSHQISDTSELSIEIAIYYGNFFLRTINGMPSTDLHPFSGSNQCLAKVVIRKPAAIHYLGTQSDVTNYVAEGWKFITTLGLYHKCTTTTLSFANSNVAINAIPGQYATSTPVQAITAQCSGTLTWTLTETTSGTSLTDENNGTLPLSLDSSTSPSNVIIGELPSTLAVGNVYTFQVRVTSSLDASAEGVYTIAMTIVDPCLGATAFVAQSQDQPAGLDSYDYAGVVSIVAKFEVNVPQCTPTFSCSVDKALPNGGDLCSFTDSSSNILSSTAEYVTGVMPNTYKWTFDDSSIASNTVFLNEVPAGTYEITLTASFTSTSGTVTDDVIVPITFVDPCESSELTATWDSVSPILYTIGDPAVTITASMTDSVSDARGDQTGLTFCGTRTFSLVSAPEAWFTFSESSGQLTIEEHSNFALHDTVKTIEVDASLTDYTELVTRTTFDVRFQKPCSEAIITVPQSTLPIVTYTTWDAALTQSIATQFLATEVDVQNCGSTFATIQMDSNGDQVAEYLDATVFTLAGDTDITIYSEDGLKAGTYNLLLTVGLTDHSPVTSNPPVTALTVEIVDYCTASNGLTITADVNPQSFLYNFDGSQVTISPADSFTTSFPLEQCPIGSYECAIVSPSGTILDCNQAVGSLTSSTFDTASGQFTFESTDIGNGVFEPGSDYTVRITAKTGTNEDVTAIKDFVLSLPCRLIENAEFTQSMPASIDQQCFSDLCLVNQEQVDYDASFSLATMKVEETAHISANGLLNQSIVDIAQIVKEARSVFKVEEMTACGNFTFSIMNPSKTPFIEILTESMQLTIAPTSTTSPGFYSTHIVFSYDLTPEVEYLVEVNIEIAGCLPNVKFSSSRTTFDYVLGSGPQSLTLPSLTQKPECGLVFNEFVIDDSLAQNDLGPLAPAVQLQVDGQKMLVEATDIALLDKQIDIFVDITQSDKEKVSRSTPAIVTIKFISDPSTAKNLLALDLQKLAVPRITCSPEDANWAFKLPPFLNLDKSDDDVVFTLLAGSSQDLLVFDNDKRTLSLSPLKITAIMRGETCPSSNVSLQFNLRSEKLGAESILPIVIPVVPNKDSQFVHEKLPALKVSKSQISSTGELTIDFNSNVLWPTLKTGAEGRVLTAGTKDAGLDISELIKAKVLETGEDDDDVKKSIVSLALESVSPQQLVVQVDFEYPEAISPDIREPDELLIEFYKPELVLQEGTRDQLPVKEASVTLNITPQFTQEKYESLLDQAFISEKVTWLLPLLEFLALFSSGKVIFQMWSLILCLQFVVYMALWLIPLDPTIRLIVDNLRYIVLNQLLDKYDFAAIAQESLGLGSFQVSVDNVTEKVGFERLSDQSGILANLGPTFMMTLLVICLILLFVGIIYLITKLLKQENSQLGILIDKAQKKVFFQMFIRYLFLNALKLDMTLMIDLTNSEGSKLVTAILLGIFTTIPAGFALLLWRIRNDLDDENKKTRYGNLYTDFNHQSVKEQKILYAYHTIFFVRRSLFIVLAVLLFDSPNLQLALQLILTLGTASFILHFRVFLDETRIKTEAVNEMLLLFITALLQLSLAYQEEDQKQYIGWCLIVTIATLIIFNAAMMIHFIQQQRRKRKFEELKQFYEFQKKLYELQLAKQWIEERRDLRYNRRRDRHLIWQLQQREALQRQQQLEQEQERAKLDISNVIVEEVRQDRREQPQTQEIVVETENSGAESSEDCDYHSSDEDEETPTQMLNGEGHNMRTVQNIPTNKKAPVSVRSPQKSKRAKLRGKGKKGSLTSRARSTHQNVPKKPLQDAKTFSRTSRRPGKQDTRTGSNVRERKRNANDRTQVPEEESEDDLENFGYENCVTAIYGHSYVPPMTTKEQEYREPEPEKLIRGSQPLEGMFPEAEFFKWRNTEGHQYTKFVIPTTNPACKRPQSRDEPYEFNQQRAPVTPKQEPQRGRSHETKPSKLLHNVPQSYYEEIKKIERAMAMPHPTFPSQPPLPQPTPPTPPKQPAQVNQPAAKRNRRLSRASATLSEYLEHAAEVERREKLYKNCKNDDELLEKYRADIDIMAKTRPAGRQGSRR